MSAVGGAFGRTARAFRDAGREVRAVVLGRMAQRRRPRASRARAARLPSPSGRRPRGRLPGPRRRRPRLRSRHRGIPSLAQGRVRRRRGGHCGPCGGRRSAGARTALLGRACGVAAGVAVGSGSRAYGPCTSSRPRGSRPGSSPSRSRLFPRFGGGAGSRRPARAILGLTPTPTVHTSSPWRWSPSPFWASALSRSSFGPVPASRRTAAGGRRCARRPIARRACRLRRRGRGRRARWRPSRRARRGGRPGRFDSLLSFKLFVAVLVGGAATALGPVAGVLALGGLSLAADLLADITGADEARFGTSSPHCSCSSCSRSAATGSCRR